MRNKDYRAKKREKKKNKKEEEVTGDGDTKTEEAKQASRIKSFDYQSWDKFDVVSLKAYKTHLALEVKLLCYQLQLLFNLFDLLWQEKVLEEMDKEEDCPVESNESDSEEAPVDPEKAQAEKEKVDIICEALKKGKIDVVLDRPIKINPMCCYRCASGYTVKYDLGFYRGLHSRYGVDVLLKDKSPIR